MSLKLPIFRSKQSPPHLRFPGPPTHPHHLEPVPPTPPHHPEHRVQTLPRERTPFSSSDYPENEILATDSLYGSSLEIPNLGYTFKTNQSNSQTKQVNKQAKQVNHQTFSFGRNITAPSGLRQCQNNKYFSIKGTEKLISDMQW